MRYHLTIQSWRNIALAAKLLATLCLNRIIRGFLKTVRDQVHICVAGATPIGCENIVKLLRARLQKLGRSDGIGSVTQKKYEQGRLQVCLNDLTDVKTATRTNHWTLITPIILSRLKSFGFVDNVMLTFTEKME